MALAGAAICSRLQARALAQGLTALTPDSIPEAAQVAVGDLLEHGAHMKAGQRILLVAYLDGLYGGDNLVDRTAIEWIRRGVEERGGHAEVLWVDAPARADHWEFPGVVRRAMDRSDLVINHSFDLTVEEILDFRNYVERDHHIPMVRNFATTAPLLCTAWAQTPQELVSEIRVQASKKFVPGAAWEITDPNGTHLKGTILPARNPTLGYATRREIGNYLPWPEWVCPPISLARTSGSITFDRTLSWWSRYVGVPPYFEHPVTLTIEDARIVRIEGKEEADAIRRYVEYLAGRLGPEAYNFDTLHFGVHPQAHAAIQQCPSILYRRLIEHSDSHNLHVHVGSAKGKPDYPYWPHITGDIRQATFTIGDATIYENGRLTALRDTAVMAIAAKYPQRPGVDPAPFEG
jgi:hypothetical protein